MAVFAGTLGLQFTTHIASHYTVPELVDLADLAHAQGFDRVWVNDNLRYRHLFVVLTAIAARVDIGLGTAILVPSFRHPVDVADGIASLSELRPGREITIGIARGDLGIVGQQVRVDKPISLVVETVAMLKELLRGRTVAYRDFPTLVDYFHLNPAVGTALSMVPQSPVRFFSGGNGPKIMAAAGRLMDGVLISGMYIPFVRSGRLQRVLAPAEQAASQQQPPRAVRKVCELNVALAPDPEQALDFARHYAAHATLILDRMGFTADEYEAAGIEPSAIGRLKRLFREGATVEQAARAVPDELARACFAIGSAEQVADEVVELCRQAAAFGFEQVVFAKLGPDYRYAINGLARTVLPALG